MSTAPITLLGMGAMGSALASTLLDHGFSVTVWNRTAAKTEPLTARGASAAATPADAVAAAGSGGAVIVCLLDYASVEQTLAGVNISERTVINLTNGTPAEARDLAIRLTARGAHCLDGGIMAIPPTVGSPHAFVYYSGPRDVLEAHRPTLEPFGAIHYTGADHGLAALQDIALLSAMYGLFGGVAHAFALTASAGVPAQHVADGLGAWLQGMASLIPDFAEQLDTGDCETDVSSTLGMQLDAYHNLIAAAAEQGVSTELLLPMRALIERAVAAGGEHSDTMRIVRHLYQAAGTRA